MSWRWVRDPLVHFLAIGALLFLVFEWRGGAGPGSARIVVTQGQVGALAAAFERTWQRAPTPDELKIQIDEYIREEIATREAMEIGLDRDDTIIRRRLRQKLEFLAEDAVDAAPATDADLQAWLEAHPEGYGVEPELSFRQVFLSQDRRGASAEDDARKMRVQLAALGGEVAIDAFGDSIMLPPDVAHATQTDVARQFGDAFADALVQAETGRWVGPVASSYGVHVVFVRDRTDARLPPLVEVRPLVERDFTADRRRRELDRKYDELLSRYRVVIERRIEAPLQRQPPTAGSSGGTR